jgi:tetratricopeptide (TPR) repeat protein
MLCLRRLTEFFEPGDCLVRVAPKEKNMKRTLSLGLGLLAFACLPAFSQLATTPDAAPAPAAPLAKIHGHVTNPTGVSATNGTIGLSNDDGHTSKYTFSVNADGDYTGEAKPGTYIVIYRQPNTPPDKMVDELKDVKLVLGVDTAADIDMTRKEFIDNLSSDEKKQLEELKAKNAKAMQANQVIKQLNGDLRTVGQDIKDADAARTTAIAVLGTTPTPTKAEIDAKEAEIKAAKYTEVETLMLRDTAAKPDASVLWAQLCKGQLGLKKYDDAEPSCKKALDLDTTSKKPNPQTQGAVESDLGEIYARTGKVAEANAAYDAAAKINPPAAYIYLKNEAVIFSQVGNADAQVAAADEAIKADPTKSLPYYLKGQGLIGKATYDDKQKKIVLPDDCTAAYQKYLELDPNGVYANDVKGILAQAAQKIDSGFKTTKKK